MMTDVMFIQMMHHVLDFSPDKLVVGEVPSKLSNNWLKMHKKPMRRHDSINGDSFASVTKMLSSGHPIIKTVHSNSHIPYGSL